MGNEGREQVALILGYEGDSNNVNAHVIDEYMQYLHTDNLNPLPDADDTQESYVIDPNYENPLQESSEESARAA